jgi:creatinine amidohydrolase/Fe(II)-dependent formamide hydrolase-like protein
LLLYLTPHLVKMERAEKPDITLPDECWQILGKRREYPELMNVFGAMLGVPSGTGKGGASDEISSNGLWIFNDPGEATTERGQKTVEGYVDRIVRFIKAWQAVSSKDE